MLDIGAAAPASGLREPCRDCGGKGRVFSSEPGGTLMRSMTCRCSYAGPADAGPAVPAGFNGPGQGQVAAPPIQERSST